MLLSSHLLHEVEVIADQLVIIGGGRIVAEGSKDELLAAAGTLRTLDVAARPRCTPSPRAGIPSTLAGAGSVRMDAEPARVGAVARPPGSR